MSEAQYDNGGLVEERVALVREDLRRRGYETEVIRYPREKRSVDILVRGLALIRVVEDTSELNHKGFRDLLAGSAVLGVSTLVVSEKIDNEKIEPGIVFEKHGVRVVNLETFRAYLSGEKISVYEWRGSFYIKIDGRRLRELRERAGMSIGDLAERLRVSRKTVYEYERGEMDPDIDHGELLVDFFGEEIAGSLDLFSPGGFVIDREKTIKRLSMISSNEDRVVRRINRAGVTAVKLHRTAPDIIGVYEREPFMVVVDSPRRSIEERARKLREALKFSRLMGYRAFLAGDRASDEVAERAGARDIEVFRIESIERDLIESMRKR